MRTKNFCGFVQSYGYGDSRGLGTYIYHYKNGEVVQVEFKEDKEYK